MLARLRALLWPSPPAPAAEQDAFARELAELEERLQQLKARTEAMAKIRYTQWRLRREKDKEHYLHFGLTVPLTSQQAEQDRFFEELEMRLDTERRQFLEHTRAIEDRTTEEERAERAQLAAERVLAVLEGDLG